MNKNRQNATPQKEVVDVERRLSQQLARVRIHTYHIYYYYQPNATI